MLFPVKISFHSIIQRNDVQSGTYSSHRCSNSDGMTVGAGSACGCREWNKDSSLRDKASATVLWDPKMWLAENWHWKWATIHASECRRCPMPRSLDEWLLIAATAAVLSKSTHTDFPVQRWPQRATAKAIGMSSVIDMWASVSMPAHSNCNQWESQNAPWSWCVWSKHKLWWFRNQRVQHGHSIPDWNHHSISICNEPDFVVRTSKLGRKINESPRRKI